VLSQICEGIRVGHSRALQRDDAILAIHSKLIRRVSNELRKWMSQTCIEGDLAGTPGSFSPSVRRRRCSQAGGDVLRQDAAVLRYASRVIRIMRAQKPTRFPGMAPDALARLQRHSLQGRCRLWGKSGWRVVCHLELAYRGTVAPMTHVGLLGRITQRILAVNLTERTA
jgi:hypothetical protein